MNDKGTGDGRRRAPIQFTRGRYLQADLNEFWPRRSKSDEDPADESVDAAADSVDQEPVGAVPPGDGSPEDVSPADVSPADDVAPDEVAPTDSIDAPDVESAADEQDAPPVSLGTIEVEPSLDEAAPEDGVDEEPAADALPSPPPIKPAELSLDAAPGGIDVDPDDLEAVQTAAAAGPSIVPGFTASVEFEEAEEDFSAGDSARRRQVDEDEEEDEVGFLRRALNWVLTLISIGLVILAWPLAFGGIFSWTIVSGASMEPLYHTGDLALTLKSFDGYEVGQIIVYTVKVGNQEGMVIHRIIKKQPDGSYLTKGDNKELPDQHVAKPELIRGKVVFLIPQGWRAISILRSPLAWALPFGLLVIYIFWPRQDEDDEDEDEGIDFEIDQEQDPDMEMDQALEPEPVSSDT